MVSGEKLFEKKRRLYPDCGSAGLCDPAGGLVGCKSHVSGDVMATVDGRKIFRSDIDKYYENQVASAQQAPAGEQATILRLNILRQLIDDEMVMHRAEKLGLLATEEEVDRKLNEIKSPYTQQEFDQRLKEKKIIARRLQTRHPPLYHRGQGDEQGSVLQDQRDRPGHHRLLHGAQV